MRANKEALRWVQVDCETFEGINDTMFALQPKKLNLEVIKCNIAQLVYTALVQ